MPAAASRSARQIFGAVVGGIIGFCVGPVTGTMLAALATGPSGGPSAAEFGRFCGMGFGLAGGAFVGAYLGARPMIAKWTLGTGAIIGAVTFLLGFAGPIILKPDSPQGPLLGIFVTGPLGFILGMAIGFAIGITRQSRAS